MKKVPVRFGFRTAWRRELGRGGVGVLLPQSDVTLAHENLVDVIFHMYSRYSSSVCSALWPVGVPSKPSQVSYRFFFPPEYGSLVMLQISYIRSFEHMLFLIFYRPSLFFFFWFGERLGLWLRCRRPRWRPRLDLCATALRSGSGSGNGGCGCGCGCGAVGAPQDGLYWAQGLRDKPGKRRGFVLLALQVK